MLSAFQLENNRLNRIELDEDDTYPIRYGLI